MSVQVLHSNDLVKDEPKSHFETAISNKTMSIQNQFSCFLIGEGTLPIQCAELLLERGHQIFGVISPDASISSWTKGKDIPYIQPTDNLIAFLRQQPFDYLFNIVNSSLLPKEILELPRQLAINYHDAALPKYAGVNATSWALMHWEKTHGVTWHVMSDWVEGGDILKQVAIDIADDDTAFTLNGKCYEAAIRSFEELVDELSSGQALAIKQNLEELIAQHEAFWVEKLATLQPITVPYADQTASHLNQKQYTSVKMSIPDEVTTFLEEGHPAWNQSDFLFAAFATYLGRIGG